MTTQHNLSVADIRPYVRHVRRLRIHARDYPALLRAYDCRLCYVLHGEGVLHIADLVRPLSENSVAIWQPNTDFRIEASSDTMDIISVSFDFTGARRDLEYPIPADHSDQFDQTRIVERVSFADMESLDGCAYLQSFPAVRDEIVEMQNEYAAQKLFWRERLGGLLTSVLMRAARALALCQPGNTGDEQCIDSMIDYIHEHADQELSNPELGKQFGFHPNYLNRQMLLGTGKTLHQYLIACRIAEAIELLETTDIPITEIAERTGTGSLSHFSKLFKRKTGNSPSYYRRA